MRLQTLMMCAVLIVAAHDLAAQEPLPPDTKSSVEANVGNNVLQLRYQMQATIQQKSDFDLGVLLAQDRQVVATGALMFDIPHIALSGLQIEIGPQGYLAWLSGTRKTQIFALSGGVTARYEVVPQFHVAVFGSAFYSPEILTFGAANNVYDFIAGADISFTDRLTVLAGYRWLKFSLDQQPDDKLQNEVFAGLRWRLK